MSFKLDKQIISTKCPFHECFKDFPLGFYTSYINSANPYFLHFRSVDSSL